MLRTGPYHSWRGGLGPVGSQRSGRDPSSGGPPALRRQGLRRGEQVTSEREERDVSRAGVAARVHGCGRRGSEARRSIEGKRLFVS
jgi:hypothetical protein